jgi:hypothetical protein
LAKALLLVLELLLTPLHDPLSLDERVELA